MFCNQCGSPNPDGSKFCAVCGNPIVRPGDSTPPPPPAYTPPARSEQDNARIAYSQRFCTEWRKFVASPLVLATIITYTAYIAFSIIGVLSTANLSYYGVDSSILVLILILTMTPTALIGVGLWKAYVDARDLSSRPIEIGGFKLIKGVFIALMVLFGIGAFLMLIGLAAVGDALDDLGISGLYAGDAEGIVVLVALISLAALGAILAVTMKLVNNIIAMAENAIPNTAFLTGYAIYLFIASGLGFIISASSSQINLDTILSLAVNIMFGIVLIKLKALMVSLSTDTPRYSSGTPNNYF